MAAAAPNRQELLAVLARLAGAESLAAFNQEAGVMSVYATEPLPGGGDAQLAGAGAAALCRALSLCAPRREGPVAEMAFATVHCIALSCATFGACVEACLPNPAARAGALAAVQRTGACAGGS